MEGTELKKLLIVDDDAVVLRTMKDALSDHFKIYGANSGQNALKVLERIPIDLILLDYEMPEMNGPEVLKTIRATQAISNLPVLFLTGKADGIPGVPETDYAGFLQKGTPVAEIIARIEEVLAESS